MLLWDRCLNGFDKHRPKILTWWRRRRRLAELNRFEDLWDILTSKYWLMETERRSPIPKHTRIKRVWYGSAFSAVCIQANQTEPFYKPNEGFNLEWTCYNKLSFQRKETTPSLVESCFCMKKVQGLSKNINLAEYLNALSVGEFTSTMCTP